MTHTFDIHSGQCRRCGDHIEDPHTSEYCAGQFSISPRALFWGLVASSPVLLIILTLWILRHHR